MDLSRVEKILSEVTKSSGECQRKESTHSPDLSEQKEERVTVTVTFIKTLSNKVTTLEGNFTYCYKLLHQR